MVLSTASGRRLSRTDAALAAVVVGVLAVATLLGVISVKAINRSANRAPAEMMIRALPATYQPPTWAVPAAQAAPLRIGRWTQARGVEIARRAVRWISLPYSFGGGGADGPSYGTPVDWDSRNDDKVYGFDCSGLTMYAVAPWLHLDHDAAAQYDEVGSYHPALDMLMPGDLVFWSKDGSVQGIGHVAVYVGDGKVVQAPRSGDVIRITPIYEVESGTMGATRPLT